MVSGRLSDSRGSGSASSNSRSAASRSGSSTTQVTVRDGWADDPQTGVGGDPDVGESQDQGQPVRLAHGQVDQTGSAAVTSRP